MSGASQKIRFEQIAQYIRTGQLAQAQQHLSSHLQKNRKDIIATKLLALSHVAEGDLAAAEALFRSILIQVPNDNTFRYDLAVVLIKQGKIQLAAAELNRLYQDGEFREKASRMLAFIHQSFTHHRSTQTTAARLKSVDAVLKHAELEQKAVEQEEAVKGLITARLQQSDTIKPSSTNLAQDTVEHNSENISQALERARLVQDEVDAHTATTLIPIEAFVQDSLADNAPISTNTDFILAHIGDTIEVRVGNGLYGRSERLVAWPQGLEIRPPERRERGISKICGLHDAWMNAFCGVDSLRFQLNGEHPAIFNLNSETFYVSEKHLQMFSAQLHFENGRLTNDADHRFVKLTGKGGALLTSKQRKLTQTDVPSSGLCVRLEDLAAWTGELTLIPGQIELNGQRLWIVRLSGTGHIWTTRQL